MQQIVWRVVTLTLLALLAGCEHPFARLSTHQDPKYPIARTSKIALPETISSTTVDLGTRLAGESLKEELEALGYHLTSADEADFQLNFNVSEKDESETYEVTVPTMSTVVGSAGDHLVTGTVVTDQVVPRTHVIDMTVLQVTLRRTQAPPVEVWSGHIAAPTGDAEKFRPVFFRALLERIGETTNGAAQLDVDQTQTKP